MKTWKDLLKERLSEVLIDSTINDIVRQLYYDIQNYGEDVVLAFTEEYKGRAKESDRWVIEDHKGQH